MKTIQDFINEKLNTSKFDTSHAQTRDELIKRTIRPTKLKHLDTSKFNTSHVKPSHSLFNKYDDDIDISKFDTTHVKNLKDI